MATLSVIIITHNEAGVIRRCLDSVTFADEIIVVDSGSDDNTRDICREYTGNIIQADWEGYGPQKNKALAAASCDWVLSIDADEVLTPALKTAIQQAIKQPDIAAYRIRFQNYYCGQAIRFGSCIRESHLRLFQRHLGKFTNNTVHENILVEGKIGRISAPIEHYSYANLDEVLEKMNRYSSLGAQQRQQQGKKGSIFSAIGHGLWTFIRCYFIRFGLFDGKAGFMMALANAHCSYYTQLKLAAITQVNAL